jgi:hypothetical protein
MADTLHFAVNVGALKIFIQLLRDKLEVTWLGFFPDFMASCFNSSNIQHRSFKVGTSVSELNIA